MARRADVLRRPARPRSRPRARDDASIASTASAGGPHRSWRGWPGAVERSATTIEPTGPDVASISKVRSDRCGCSRRTRSSPPTEKAVCVRARRTRWPLSRHADRAAVVLGRARARPDVSRRARRRRRRVAPSDLRRCARRHAPGRPAPCSTATSPPTGPIVILSGNSIEHAVLALAAMHVGVPYAPIAPSYSLLSQDHRTLDSIWSSMRPGLVFARDGPLFERALASVPDRGCRDRHVHAAARTARDAASTHSSRLRRRRASTRRTRVWVPTRRQDPVHVRVDRPAEGRDQHAAHARGEPGADPGGDGVSRRRAAGAVRLAAVEPHVRRQPQLRPDALQRRHALYRCRLAGAGHFGTTLANLREIATTAYFNVPKGYELLLPALRATPNSAGRSSAGCRCCSMRPPACGKRYRHEFDAWRIAGVRRSACPG